MILHITNDYSGSTVYKNLIQELDLLGVQQIVYNPVKTVSRIGKNQFEFKTEGSKIIYSHIINNTTDKIFYRFKIKKIYEDLASKVDLKSIKLIHAHTWFTDGGVAYRLHQNYGTPYMVSIRSTGLNDFYTYVIHERQFGKKVLDAAKNIICFSGAYKNRLLNLPVVKPIKGAINKKITVIPHGVADFWIENANYPSLNNKRVDKKEINLLYIGTFKKRKKVSALQNAVIELNRTTGKKINFNIVGGIGPDEKRIKKLLEKHPQHFNYYGIVKDKTQVLQIYRNNDFFVMPSKRETFGLVYIEALLQGLPLLYTKNEGIDGIYDDMIGIKVENQSQKEVKNKLANLIFDNHEFNIPTEKLVLNHNWKTIAKKYFELYSSDKTNL